MGVQVPALHRRLATPGQCRARLIQYHRLLVLRLVGRSSLGQRRGRHFRLGRCRQEDLPILPSGRPPQRLDRLEVQVHGPFFSQASRLLHCMLRRSRGRQEVPWQCHLGQVLQPLCPAPLLAPQSPRGLSEARTRYGPAALLDPLQAHSALESCRRPWLVRAKQHCQGLAGALCGQTL